MSRDLSGKVALVTGGSDGIGRATARLLLKRGATVAICGRRQELLDASTAELGSLGTFEAHQLDVSDEAAFCALIQDIANYLPFTMFKYVPIQIILGRLSEQEIVRAYFVGVIWLVISILLFNWIWREGVKKFSAVGA